MIDSLFERYMELTKDANSAATLVLAHCIAESPESAAAPLDVMTVQQAALHLNVAASTVYTLCSRGQLRHTRIGRAIRIRRDALGSIKVDSGDNIFKRATRR